MTGFMVVLDSQIVILALPSIERGLDVSVEDGQWVLSAYMLAFGGLLLFGGRLADLRGRRQMFIVGTALFLVSSLLCGFAWSAAVLIGARVVQGVSAALMAPTSLAILMGMFPEGPERNKALAFWSGVGGIGATASLLIGGPITDTLGWAWIFFINVPVSVVMLVFAPILFPESRGRSGRRAYDPAGALTSTVGLMLLIGAIVLAPAKGWLSGPALGMLLGSAVLLGLFVLVESRAVAPLVPLQTFRSRLFVGGNLAMSLFAAITVGMSIAVTAYAQQVLGYTPLQFGLGMVAMTVMAVVGSYVGQAGLTKIGFRPVVATAAVAMGVGVFLLSQVTVHGTYFADLFPGLLMFGLGLGAGPVAAVAATLSAVDQEIAGVASGAANAGFQIGGALGAAVTSAIVVSNGGDSAEPARMTNGFGAGLTGDLVIAVGCLSVALVLLRPKQPAPGQDRDPGNGEVATQL
ncbi:MFS transporter [Actinomadura barringtoniae]|uniref:MFS transporter n=1 Tax=Actinomadura barringtoniae TaxID=1427535 RepID=A0A939P5W9_9ACTN|nr:MFS transporter [Actinomadura barringtoniae]MBO2445932.1 MFS transporter [Actinomadura barringtoniae]